MNVTDKKNDITGKTRGKSGRGAKRAMVAVSEYVSRVLAASALTMWGALNLIVSIRNAFAETGDVVPDVGDASETWYITLGFVAVTALLPFLIGLHLFRKLYQQTKVR